MEASFPMLPEEKKRRKWKATFRDDQYRSEPNQKRRRTGGEKKLLEDLLGVLARRGPASEVPGDILALSDGRESSRLDL
jgi:hypothetical protein